MVDRSIKYSKKRTTSKPVNPINVKYMDKKDIPSRPKEYKYSLVSLYAKKP